MNQLKEAEKKASQLVQEARKGMHVLHYVIDNRFVMYALPLNLQPVWIG